MFDDKDGESQLNVSKIGSEQDGSKKNSEQPPEWNDIPMWESDAEKLESDAEKLEKDTTRQSFDNNTEYGTINPLHLQDEHNADDAMNSTIPSREDGVDEINSVFMKKSKSTHKKFPFETQKVTKKTIIMGVLGLAIVIGAVVNNSATDSVGDENVPVVQPNAVIKEAPVDPKGMKIEHLDKAVYGAVNDVNVQAENTIEKLLPKIEKPIVIEKIKPKAVKVEPVKKKVKKVVVKKTTVKKIASKNADAKKAPKKTEVSVSKAINKSWKVQLASVSSAKGAKKKYAKSKKKFSVLKSSKLYIEIANVKGKLYYRVQAVGFKTKSLAIKACEYIKSQGSDCLVKK